MNPAAHLFVEDLRKWSEESLDWCIKSSESASGKIADAIDILLNDTARVSQVSSDSIEAISVLRDNIVLMGVGNHGKITVNNLIDTLKDLCNDHQDVKYMINPVLEALQFQDRMKQNIDNMMKMLVCWLNYRVTVERKGSFTKEDEVAFAAQLYDCTTMAEERDLIEKAFPNSNRPKEAVGANVEFF